MKKKIAILTTFQSLPTSYGLVPVVLNQLRMLIDHGYEPHLFTVEGFEKHRDTQKLPKGTFFRSVVPFLHLFDYQAGTKQQKCKVPAKGLHHTPHNKTNFKKQVQLLKKQLNLELAQFKVVITHDIMFQTWFVPHNQAIRLIGADHPEIKWIHWMHSGPSTPPQEPEYPHTLRCSGMWNSVFVSPNDSMAPKFAEMYNVPLKKIKTVYHTFDACKFMHPLSRELIKKHNLFEGEVLCVWPTRIDHPEAKGLKKTVWLIAQMNKTCDAKLIFLNSWSRGEKAKLTIQSLRKEAELWGLPLENLVFSSEMGEAWEDGVPHQVVHDMFRIGNLFILPSETETFSLVMLEAAAYKNLLVLNEDLTVMKELAEDNALYVPFGSCWGGERVSRQYQPNVQWFMLDRAREILIELFDNKILCQHRKVLKVFNQHWVFKNQLKPLIEGGE